MVKAVNSVGEKDCTLALNFGGVGCWLQSFIFRKNHKYFPAAQGGESEDNVPARIYEQPLLLQPDPATLVLEAHIHANPKPKASHLFDILQFRQKIDGDRFTTSPEILAQSSQCENYL